MKNIARYILPIAGLACTLPQLRAEQDEPEQGNQRMVVTHEDDDGHPEAGQHRMMRRGGHQEMETVTFLGIESQRVTPALADQLNLPPGTGLVVATVMPDSPAGSALKRNDVLTKVDDQLLIEPGQLRVLIQNHEEGDEVKLTYIRGGKEGTAKVKLATHDVPKMAFHRFMPGMPGMPDFNMRFGGDGSFPDMQRDDMDRVLALIDRQPGIPPRRLTIERNAGPGLQTTTVNTSNSNMVFSDDQGSLDLTIKDGKKTLIAKDAKGAQLFSGPVTTPEERKALPKDVRQRLEKLEGMQGVSFETDEHFQGGKMRVVTPNKTKIAAPERTMVPDSMPHSVLF